MGAPGPAGALTGFREIDGAVFPSAAVGSTASTELTCPAGKVALNAGFNMDIGSVSLVESRSLGATRWRFSFRSTTVSGGTPVVFVHVTCVDGAE